MPEVRIAVKVGDVQIAFRGSRAFYEQWIEPLVHAAYHRSGTKESPRSVEATPAAPPPEPGVPSFQPSSPAQFNRFVGQVGARAAEVDQRIMAFAFYLWNFERKDDFELDQIASFFRTVQDDPPEDLPERLHDLSGRRRFMEQAGDAEVWRLTSKGVNYVKNRLLA